MRHSKAPVIYCVGVDHQVQHNGPTMIPEREKAMAQFSLFVESKAKTLNVTLLAEEFNEDAMKDSCASESTVRAIAKQLGIRHLFCDPTRAQRKERGIGKDIALRENYWLARLNAHRTENILFVCGADHVETFGKKLIQDGYQVQVLSEQFGIGLPRPIIN